MAKHTPIVRQDLRWTDSAPIALVGRTTTTASPADVFAELADHERWPEWFPNVKKVEVLGPATGVGARRRVHIPGGSVEEEFIAWEPGSRWAFTGTAASSPFLRSIVEDCHLIPIGDGGTAITYTMYLQGAPWARPFLAIAKRAIGKGLQQGMENLAARAAKRSS